MNLQSTNLTEIFQSIPLFHGFSSEILFKLAQISHLREIPPQEILFKEGDVDRTLYILLDGEVKLSCYAPGYGEVIIAKAEPLDIIGWSSMTSMIRQRLETAQSIRRSTVLCINAEALQKICDEVPSVGYQIIQRVANLAATTLMQSRINLLQVIREQASQIHKEDTLEFSE
ncbi:MULTISPECIES: Crp/Fnr family transcriptional regulator [Anaerolinea]|uniref:Crp/Fnr family transcriptional regulator n=1 Tax=Anaerolinea TaxID=233189 RepID=UPI002612A4ED|nr:cyclic nucleotide-binding domain-containing protein [Anaerolinea thermophila]